MNFTAKIAAVTALTTLAFLPAFAAAGPDGAAPYTVNREHAGYLGVGLHDVTADSAAQLKLKDARGVEVIAIDRDGPSASLLQEHDVILELNGQRVDTAEQIRHTLRDSSPGKKATLSLSRDGKPVQVEVVLGDRAAVAHLNLPDVNIQLPDMDQLQGQLSEVESMGDLGDVDMEVMLHGALAGAVVETVGPQLARYFGSKDGSGVLVREVRDNTPAEKAGMRAGDFIVRAAGQPVPSRLEWDRRLRENRGKPMHVEILRDHRDEKLLLTLPARTAGELTKPLNGDDADGLEMPEVVAQLDQDSIRNLTQNVESVQAQAGQLQPMIDELSSVDASTIRQQVEDAKQMVEDMHLPDVEELKRQAKAAMDASQIDVKVKDLISEKELREIQKVVDEALAGFSMD